MWYNKFICQIIMLITHHDEKKKFFRNLWCSIYSFFVWHFFVIWWNLFSKNNILSNIPCLQKKEGRSWNIYIYNHHVESTHCSNLNSHYIKIFIHFLLWWLVYSQMWLNLISCGWWPMWQHHKKEKKRKWNTKF
jgi:hypothetical protein